MCNAIVGYQRVSTKGQGESGLGIEAQEAAIQAYARQTGAKLVAMYTEIESGKLVNRPELGRALAHARRSKATLVVAKLDRLARNVAFLSALMDSKVPFVACDNPHANRLVLHILGAMAEAEAVAISQRTKAALAAYKARGGKLGGQLPQCRNLTAEARAKGIRKAADLNRRNADEAYADLIPTVQSLKAEGLALRAIAARLNTEGHTTRRGRSWNQTQVSRLLDRAGRSNSMFKLPS